MSVAVSAGQAKGNTAVAVAAFGKLRRKISRKIQSAGPAVALAVGELGRSENLALVLEMGTD